MDPLFLQPGCDLGKDRYVAVPFAIVEARCINKCYDSLLWMLDLVFADEFCTRKQIGPDGRQNEIFGIVHSSSNVNKLEQAPCRARMNQVQTYCALSRTCSTDESAHTISKVNVDTKRHLQDNLRRHIQRNCRLVSNRDDGQQEGVSIDIISMCRVKAALWPNR